MCHLSFDETGQHQFDADQSHAAYVWFVSFAVDYLHHYHLSQHEHTDDIRAAVRQQYANFMGSAALFNDIQSTATEMRSRQAAVSPPSQDTHYSFWNPKSVWYLYLHGAPELATAAIALLSVAGSEAACERSFSAQSLVHTKQRNRLRDDHVEQEMFIRFNCDALESNEQRAEAQQVTSLTPDCDEPRDSAAYIKVMFAAVENREAEGKKAREENVMRDEEAAVDDAPAVVLQPPLPLPVTLLERFINYYVQKHGLVVGYKWLEWRLNQLQQEAIGFDPPVKDTVTVDELKKQINAYLRGTASTSSSVQPVRQ